MTQPDLTLEQHQANFRRYGEPQDLDQLCEFVCRVIRGQGHDLVGFAVGLYRPQWVTNAHKCPLGGTTNWLRERTRPRGYPGWAGWVWVRLGSSPFPHSGSDIFKNTATHTGSGGFGSYKGPWARICQLYKSNRSIPEPICYSWDYCIFDQDWPQVADWWAKCRLMDRLSGDPYNCPNFNYVWEDPEVVKQDQQYLNSAQAAEVG